MEWQIGALCQVYDQDKRLDRVIKSPMKFYRATIQSTLREYSNLIGLAGKCTGRNLKALEPRFSRALLADALGARCGHRL
jgi:hypothetical protein